ncbi:transcription initiation factor TFIID subunit 4-like [Macrosteles quadrilineatus]|uniref:transcription initiation factor TFIID subunit 4-like n=1 Tax=Macrosteles quadrilineatus TaxID=74068 RepID=UPI0023E264E2|nr:transcription initiation factor TFIID subunit 4-like [Macrosteles quadrilineatus]
MFVRLIPKHLWSIWVLLGATCFPTIVIILKMCGVAHAQLYYTTGNTIQIPSFLLPSTITLNIPQTPQSTPRPAAPATFRPPTGTGAFAPAFGAPAAGAAPAPAPGGATTGGAAPGAPPVAPAPQPQTISVSITQPQQVVNTQGVSLTQPQQVVNTQLDSCLGLGCYSLLPLIPSQPVVYAQPLYYSLWNWRSWALGWRSGCAVC